MKNIKKLLLILIIIPCAFLFISCSFEESSSVYVTDIKQTSIVGNTATYTVYYSDGKTSVFTVENGKDGEDGENLTIESIKQYCETNNINFETFLKEYLTIVQETKTINDATNIAIQSAVSVWSEFPTFSNYTPDKSVSCGAGIIYKMGDAYSYIITNYHVVYYTKSQTTNKIASKIHCFQYGTSEVAHKTKTTDANGFPIINYGDGAIEAQYIGGSMNYDIAVLKVKTEDLLKYNEHAQPVAVANEYELAETAIAIGNPSSEGISVTSGIISVISENISMSGADETTPCDFRVVRIDTAVNSGNSGGGLFNSNGELIGIVNAKVIDSQIDNIAYALPVDNITKVADNLIYYHEEKHETIATVKKLYLNITYTVENSRAVYNPTTNKTILTEDIIVESVSYNAGNGVGYHMGLKPGDIIESITINETTHAFNRAFELDDLLLTIREGDKVLLTVKRENITTQLGLAEEGGVLASYLTEIK